MATKALRKLPLEQALAGLRSGSGATPLSSAVKSLSLAVAKAPRGGPRDFLDTIAPRIAYANPALPINVHRFAKKTAQGEDGQEVQVKEEVAGVTGPSLVVTFHDIPETTIPLAHLSAEQIWLALSEVAVEKEATAA